MNIHFRLLFRRASEPSSSDLKSEMPFLLFGAACFQEVPYFVISEEFLQGSCDFALFIFADLCYACPQVCGLVSL